MDILSRFTDLGSSSPLRKNCSRVVRAETKALIGGGGGGGGGAYSYIRVLPDEFLLKSTVMTTDFKRNSSGRTRIYEYTPPQLTLLFRPCVWYVVVSSD